MLRVCFIRFNNQRELQTSNLKPQTSNLKLQTSNFKHQTNMEQFPVIFVVLAFFIIIILVNAIRILREYERGVVFRLGILTGVKGPGLILLIPIIDKMVKVSLRTVVMDVPPQDIITQDNV